MNHTSFNKTDKSSRCALSISITSVKRMKEYLPSFQIKASENMAVCHTFRYLAPRGGSVCAEPPLLLKFWCLLLFDASSRSQGSDWTAAGTAHGSCTPPRISPSCPHYVPLWLGRSTIIRGRDHCEAACQSCFWMDGYRSSPYWAVFIQKICTGGLRASSASLFHFWLIRLMSFQSLDMYFSSCTRAF